MSDARDNPHIGSSLEDFLREEGIFEICTVGAVKRLVAMDFGARMKALGVSKSALAQRMGTSRPVVDRLLSDDAGVTLDTIVRAAAALDLEPSLTFSPSREPAYANAARSSRAHSRGTAVSRTKPLKKRP